MTRQASTAEWRETRSGAWHPSLLAQRSKAIKTGRYPEYWTVPAAAHTISRVTGDVGTKGAEAKSTRSSWISELFLPLAQVVTGILVAASAPLAYTLAPRLVLLPGLVGIALIVTGIQSIRRACDVMRRK